MTVFTYIEAVRKIYSSNDKEQQILTRHRILALQTNISFQYVFHDCSVVSSCGTFKQSCSLRHAEVHFDF